MFNHPQINQQNKKQKLTIIFIQANLNITILILISYNFLLINKNKAEKEEIVDFIKSDQPKNVNCLSKVKDQLKS